MQKTALSTVVGTPSELVWSQAQSFVTSRGMSVGVVLNLTQQTESELVELSEIGGAILLSLRDKCETVENMAQMLAVMQSAAEGVSHEVVVSLALCCLHDSILMLLGKGEVCGYLLRGETLIALGKGSELSEGISGKLQEGDSLCVATEATVQLVGTSTLAQILSEGREAAEAIAPVMHKEADSSLVAAVIASYGETELSGLSPVKVRMADMLGILQSAFKRPLRVKREPNEPRKINTWIAAGALLFLVVMIGFGYARRARVVAEQEYLSVSTQVEQSLAEAESVADLNPERARALLSQSMQIATAYSDKVTKEPYNGNALALLTKIQEAEKEIFKVDSVSLKPFVELDVLKNGLTSNRMYIDAGGTLFFPDTASAQVIGMSIADKSTITLDTGSVGKISAMGFFDKIYYGVTDKGIASFGQGKTEAKIVVEPDPLWGEIAQVESYAGNIYLLDKGNSEIWKYPVITDGFGERQRWLGAGITLDLSKVAAMKVTGDIWIITASGKLERYSRGAPVTFSMEGFPALSESKRLSDPAALYVTDEEVYVLERGAKRVVVIGVDGKYRAQYANEEFAQASDLVVHKSRGYVLIDGVVKEFGL